MIDFALSDIRYTAEIPRPELASDYFSSLGRCSGILNKRFGAQVDVKSLLKAKTLARNKIFSLYPSLQMQFISHDVLSIRDPLLGSS